MNEFSKSVMSCKWRLLNYFKSIAEHMVQDFTFSIFAAHGTKKVIAFCTNKNIPQCARIPGRDAG